MPLSLPEAPGALHVGASLIVRTLKGVKRPALATMVPAKNKAYLLLDCGANVECRPEMLAAFAVMGSCYVNKVEGRTAPTVALANNGAEESKGTPMLPGSPPAAQGNTGHPVRGQHRAP